MVSKTYEDPVRRYISYTGGIRFVRRTEPHFMPYPEKIVTDVLEWLKVLLMFSVDKTLRR